MRYLKPLILIVLVVALLVLSWWMGWANMVADGTFARSIGELRDQNWLASAVLYVLITVVCCVALALPGVVFAIVAGMVFGALWGTLLCWIAVSIGACLAFLAGRYFLKDSLKPLLEKSPALDKLLFSGVRRSEVYLLALTRLVPLFPYNVQNFAYGITDIRFLPYAVYSALFMIPGTAAYTFAAAGIIDESHRLPLLAAAVVLIGATLLIAAVLKRREGIS